VVLAWYLLVSASTSALLQAETIHCLLEGFLKPGQGVPEHWYELVVEGRQ
jgi:hypothetical protein